MLNLERGVGPAEEPEYQEWLALNPGGLVVSLNPGRDGRWTLHAAGCETVRYELPEHQGGRSGKVGCEVRAELEAWCVGKAIAVGGLNRCSRCSGGLDL